MLKNNMNKKIEINKIFTLIKQNCFNIEIFWEFIFFNDDDWINKIWKISFNFPSMYIILPSLYSPL